MANRYWVAGGTGNWDSTTNWSTTDGGASGASVPVSTDNAYLTALSGTGTVTLNISPTVLGFFLTTGTGSFTGTLAFGTNTITVVGTSATGLCQLAYSTGFTVTGTPLIIVTNGATISTGTGWLEAQTISFKITGSAAQAAGGVAIKNLDFTGYTGTLDVNGFYATIYGNLTFSSTMAFTAGSVLGFTMAATSGTKTITSNGTALDVPFTINGVGGTFQLVDALTLKSSSTANKFDLTNGTLDLNNKTLTTSVFSSSNSNTRTIAFGTSNITCTYSGASSNIDIWDTSTTTGLTITGTPIVNISRFSSLAIRVRSGDLPEASSISFNFTSGSYSLTFLNGFAAKNVNFTGFAGTWASRTVASTIYGNLTLATGMTLTASIGIMTFGATSGTQVITTNGKTIDGPLTINGVGGTVQLADALLMGTTRTLTHTNGTLDLNGKTLTVGTAYTTAAGTKNLTFNGGTLICPTASTTAFNNAVPTGYTTTTGTGTGKISMTAATAKTFVGGGSTFNCTLSNDGAGALTVTGANTFTTIANGVQPTSFLFTAATTTTVTNWSVSGTAGNLVTIGSVTAATHTLSKSTGTVSSDYLSVSYSIATGGATWYAGANSTNGGNNTGWIFSALPSTSTGNFFMLF